MKGKKGYKIIKKEYIMQCTTEVNEYCLCLERKCKYKKMYMMNLIDTNKLPPKKGYDISVLHDGKMSTLMDLALIFNNLKYVKLLKKVGIKTHNEYLSTDIIYSTKWNNYDAVKMHLDKSKLKVNIKDMNEVSILYHSLECGLKYNDFRIFELLLKNNANIYDYKIEDGEKIPIIMHLIAKGNENCFRVAIKYRLPILSYLVEMYGHIRCKFRILEEQFKILLKCGLNINRLINFNISKNEYVKGNALMYAIYIESNYVIPTLIDNNIDINFKIKDSNILRGFNCYHFAAFFGNIEAIKIILDSKKVNINCLDDEGRNALIIAALNSNINTVKLLLDRGINFLHKVDGRNIQRILDVKNQLLLKQNKEKEIERVYQIKKILIIHTKKILENKGAMIIQKWYKKRINEISIKKNKKKEKLKKRKKRKKQLKKKKKQMEKIEKEKEELKLLRTKYTITRGLFNERIQYTCLKCFLHRYNEERIIEHVKHCDKKINTMEKYKKHQVSLYSYLEELDYLSIEDEKDIKVDERTYSP